MRRARLERLPGPVSSNVYDGFEPSDYGARVMSSATDAWLMFTFDDLVRNDLRHLASALGEEALATVVEAHGAREALPGGPWVGSGGLALSFVLADAHLAVVGFGEWQPARYCVTIESLWRVHT